MSHPCCVESQSASHSKTKNKDGLLFFFTKIALPLSPLVMKKEHHAMSSLILFGIFDFGYDRVPFFSLSFFLPALPLPCTLSLSL